MVIKNWLFHTISLFIMTLSTSLQAGWGADAIPPYVDISTSVDLYESYENHPLKGVALITHDVGLKIDISSFQLDNKAIQVTFVKNEKMSASSPLEVSIYNFELPAQPKGLYLLPSLSAIVNEKRYFSIPISYEVSGVEAVEGKSNASLALKSYVEGPVFFYPGERGRFVYRFYFTGNIELKKEYLPLLEADGFKKIGGKQVKEAKEGALSIEEVAQEVEAIKPGEYQFPVSYVEGQAYHEDNLKRRSYFQPALKAETSELSIKVMPFPTKNKPASFNGAVGKFTLEASRPNSSKEYVGDKIELTIAVTGNRNLYTVHAPDLKLQPKFSGLFRLSDLPPAEEIRANTKYFKIELRPLSTAVNEIPPVEFSFFDPDSQKYSTLFSASIPLTVTDRPKISEPAIPVKPAPLEIPELKKVQPVEPSLPKQTFEQVPSPIVPMERPIVPPVIEIQGNYALTVSDLKNRDLGTWWVLLLIPLGALFVWMQMLWRNYLRRNAAVVKTTSAHELFDEAMQAPPYSSQFFDLLNKAFLQRLVERGELISTEISPEKLSSKGATGVVRAFLCDIEEKRFSGTQGLSHAELMEQALILFNKI